MTRSFYHQHTFNLHHRPPDLLRSCNTGLLAPTESSKRSPLSHTNLIFPKPSRYTQSFTYLFSAHTNLRTLSTIALSLSLLRNQPPSMMPTNSKLTRSSTTALAITAKN